jgi:hypothetical protein
MKLPSPGGGFQRLIFNLNPYFMDGAAQREVAFLAGYCRTFRGFCCGSRPGSRPSGNQNGGQNGWAKDARPQAGLGRYVAQVFTADQVVGYTPDKRTERNQDH